MSISEKNALNISKVLTEALPYIRKFNDKIIVIKYGGHAMQNKALQKNFARDLVLMKTVGIHPVLIHGGGPQIDLKLKKNKIPFEFKNGIRITSKQMIDIVQKVLDNEINKEISELIKFWGGNISRLSGKINSPIVAFKDNKQNIGEVGSIKSINKKKILASIKSNKIPVISPIGWTKNKSPLGGEQSGHIIKSEFSKTGDGILAALKITEIISFIKKSTSSIFDLYDNFPQIKINISYKKISEKIKKNIKDLNKKNSKDKKNRVLVRFSGTEPLIRLLVEGQVLKEVQQKAKILELEIRKLIGQ